MDGPGIAAFQGAFDGAVIDRATAAFNEPLDGQRAADLVSGDHFAKPAANDRIWGALDKLAVAHCDMPVETGGRCTFRTRRNMCRIPGGRPAGIRRVFRPQ